MSDQPAPVPSRPAKPKKEESWQDTLRFFALLLVAAILLRSIIAAPFSIPSESMLPRLLVGDYLFVAKFPYGWSRHSFPFSAAPISGRIWGAIPARGDVVVFKNPADNRTDYIKRVIGLPGDFIQMKNGQLFINDVAVPKVRVADMVFVPTPNSPCDANHPVAGDGKCHYPRFRETLPNGKSYEVLDLDFTGPADTTQIFVVPEAHLFLMGDNRDRSADSRFPAEVNNGIGLVPFDDLVGKAEIMFWSTDGSANWFLPWTWFTAARWNRIGGGF